MCLNRAQKIKPGYDRECYKVLKAFVFKDGNVVYHSPYYDDFVWEIGKRYTIEADEPVAVRCGEHPVNGFGDVLWDKVNMITCIYGDAFHAYKNVWDAKCLAKRNSPLKPYGDVCIKTVIGRFTIPEDSKFVYTGEETPWNNGASPLCYASSDLIFEEIVE